MKVSSTMEWIYYTDWCYANRMTADDITVRQWLQLALRQTMMKHQGGLLPPRLEDVGRLIDGSPFPQIITAKLETFCLQARRAHEAMRAAAVVKKEENLLPSHVGRFPFDEARQRSEQ